LSVVDFSVVVVSVDCSVEVSIAFPKESEELTTLEADCTTLYVAASTSLGGATYPLIIVVIIARERIFATSFMFLFLFPIFTSPFHTRLYYNIDCMI